MTKQLTITLETTAIADAVDDLITIHKALAQKHGTVYRAFDRKLNAFCENPDMEGMAVESVGDTLIMSAPTALSALLREARELGLMN